MLKKALIIFMILIILISLVGCRKTMDKIQTDKLNIVTSFYPIYIATLNIVDDVEDVNLTNLTDNFSGCLHEYTLNTSDLMKLENANAVIINGLGIESFTDKIFKTYPDVKIINSSEGIDVGNENVAVSEHNHENGHIWLSIKLYKQQVQNICNKLCEIDSKNALKYTENTNKYIDKLNELNTLIQEEMSNIQNKNAICLNESFEVFGEDLGLNLHTIEIGHNEESNLSGAQVASILDIMQNEKTNIIFIEKMDSDNSANIIAKENNAKIFRLDANLNGENDKNSYINAMKYNLNILKEALNAK